MRNDSNADIASGALPHQRTARRAIRAVNLGVTIDATAGEQISTGAAGGQALRRIRDGGVTRALVTGLTEKRRAQLEQRRLRRPMRVMTIRAVFRHGLMFPEKRSAVFCVTGRTGFG